MKAARAHSSPSSAVTAPAAPASALLCLHRLDLSSLFTLALRIHCHLTFWLTSWSLEALLEAGSCAIVLVALFHSRCRRRPFVCPPSSRRLAFLVLDLCCLLLLCGWLLTRWLRSLEASGQQRDDEGLAAPLAALLPSLLATRAPHCSTGRFITQHATRQPHASHSTHSTAGSRSSRAHDGSSNGLEERHGARSCSCSSSPSAAAELAPSSRPSLRLSARAA